MDSISQSAAEQVWDKVTRLSDQARRDGYRSQHERLLESVTTGKGSPIPQSDVLPWEGGLDETRHIGRDPQGASDLV